MAYGGQPSPGEVWYSGKCPGCGEMIPLLAHDPKDYPNETFPEVCGECGKQHTWHAGELVWAEVPWPKKTKPDDETSGEQ